MLKIFSKILKKTLIACACTMIFTSGCGSNPEKQQPNEPLESEKVTLTMPTKIPEGFIYKSNKITPNQIDVYYKGDRGNMMIRKRYTGEQDHGIISDDSYMYDQTEEFEICKRPIIYGDNLCYLDGDHNSFHVISWQSDLYDYCIVVNSWNRPENRTKDGISEEEAKAMVWQLLMDEEDPSFHYENEK